MTAGTQVTPFGVAPLVFGSILIVGLYPLTIPWPSGWAWHMGGVSRCIC